jgi:DNA repair protein RecN (Recombination protein N)
MLVRLTVRNLAIIREAEVCFAPGLNVITGETGAGKSILMNALGLLTGGRAHRDLIRTGEASLQVEGRFAAQGSTELGPELQALGLELTDGGLEILRAYTAAGRSRILVGGRPCPVSALRRIGRGLVEILGQHDHRLLLDVDAHRGLLDEFGGQGKLLASCAAAHRELEAVAARLRSRRMDRQEKARRIDTLGFQIGEIEALRPVPNEDVALLEEKRLLVHAEELSRLSRESHELLDGEEAGLLAGLVRVERNLERLAEIDQGTNAMALQCSAQRLELEDLAASLGEYARESEFDPDRLSVVEERLYQLEGVKRKYGPELTDVLEFLETARGELASMLQIEEEGARLEDLLAEAAGRFGELAARLSARRTEESRRLEQVMEQELADLAMEKAVFRVRLWQEENSVSPVAVGGRGLDYDRGGVDRVEFLISTNPGEEPRPLARIASGGELSRIMLALRNVARPDHGSGRVLVFDEVDAGIGGRVARVVGQKLKAIAGRDQVICITHLPQICAAADHHLSVRKFARAGRNVVRVEQLEGDARLEEIARMLGGEETPSAEVLESAQRLMQG